MIRREQIKPVIGASSIVLGIALFLFIGGNTPAHDSQETPDTVLYVPSSGIQESHYDTEIGGAPVRVFVINGVSYAYQRNCPGSTTLLDFIDGYIECPLDGSRWNPFTGEFIQGSGPANVPLQKFSLGAG